MPQLSEHFTLEEFEASATAERTNIDNTAPDRVLPALINTANGMERIRDLLYAPIEVTSGYRCEALNLVVWGQKNSQHLSGEACDFVSPSAGSPLDICRKIAQAYDIILFDQLIYEFTWVHVSFVRGSAGRNSVLTIQKGKPAVAGLPS